MNNEFKELYDDWMRAVMFKSYGQFDDPTWNTLEEWSLGNPEEAIDSIKEILLEEPDHVVQLLDKLMPDELKIDGYIDLESYCNCWLNILCGTLETGKFINYYGDYQKYQKYLDKNYIPWNPFKEEDPNPSFNKWKEEIKCG